MELNQCENKAVGYTEREFALACKVNQLKIQLDLARAKIEELQQTLASRWNSAKEQPPEADKEVLFYNEYFGCVVSKWSFAFEKAHINFTHWQPLPPIPNK